MKKYQILGHCIPEKLYCTHESMLSFNGELHQIDPYLFLLFEIPNISLKPKDILKQVNNRMEALGYALDDLKLKDYPDIIESLTDHDELNFLHHILYERNRMMDAKKSFKQKDYQQLARLMCQSYVSYKTFVQETHPVQDYLIMICGILDIIGANIDGNILVCMVESNTAQAIVEQLQTQYQNKYKGKLKQL